MEKLTRYERRFDEYEKTFYKHKLITMPLLKITPYSRVIFENMYSQKQLETLADIIIEESVKRSVDIIKNKIIEKEKEFKFYNEELTLENFKAIISPIYFPVLLTNKGKITIDYTKNKLNKEIKTFLKSLGTISIEFIEMGSKTSTKGSYVNNQIKIYIPSNIYEKAEETIIEAYERKEFPLSSKISKLVQLLLPLKDTIIHELQHYYDDWRSKGAYSSISYSNDYNSDKYWGSPEEVNARYTQTVYTLKNDSTIYKEWNIVLKEFKLRFIAWDILDRKTQKRLLSRLSQQYQELNKSKSALQDISSQVKKLQKKFDDNKVEISYHNKKYIEIIKLNTGNIKDDAVVLSQIIKLADTYRHMIMIYVEKGWVTNIKQSVNLLKNYGFNPNSGRTINYKYRTGKNNFIRYPKRG